MKYIPVCSAPGGTSVHSVRKALLCWIEKIIILFSILMSDTVWQRLVDCSELTFELVIAFFMS